MNTLNIIEEHGFRVFPEVLLPHETRRLVDDLDQSPLRRSKAGVRHALRHPSVAALAREPRLLNIAQEVLGAEARPFRATLFDKSPQANWLVVWHQDTALPLRERHDTPSWGPWSVKEYRDDGSRDVNDPVARCFRFPKNEHGAMVAGPAQVHAYDATVCACWRNILILPGRLS